MKSLMGLAACALLVGSAIAQDAPRRHLSQFEVGTPGDQLALDPVVVPAGAAAVFVPSASRPELEPQVRVLLGDEVVARGPTGRRLIVPPGRYRVVVGQGPMSWRAGTSVEAREGQTALVEDFVGSLRVTATDRQGLPQAVEYVLVSADERRVYGPETTSGNSEYEATRTWLLDPGTYRLVPGSDPDAFKGAAAVVVPPNHRVRIRLLVDDLGVVVGSEPGDLEPQVDVSPWRLNWVIGGSVALGQSRHQLNSFSGESLRAVAFTELGLKYDGDGHVATLAFDLEQTWIAFEQEFGQSLPFQKLEDQIGLELGYSYRLWRIVGPYVHTSLHSSMTPREVTSDGDYDVVTVAPDGSETVREVSRGDTIDLMPWFGPLILQEGAGLELTAWDSRVVGFGLRAGIAARQLFYHGEGRYLRGVDGGRVTLQALDNDLDWGPEVGAWFRLNVGHWMTVRSDFEGFAPMQETLNADHDFRPVFRFSSSVGFRLAEWATLLYRATLHRDDVAIDDLQFRHSLDLRFHYAIF